jgi:hypothetical protein
MAAKTRRLGALDSVSAVNSAMAKVARCMWAGEVTSSDGHKLASVLTMLREGLQAVKVEELAERLAKLEGGGD